jgi:hypothetical protein
MISTRWLAFLVAGAIAPATPAIAAAAPAQVHLPPPQVRLAHMLAHFTKAEVGQMQRNVIALDGEVQTY